MKRILLLGTLAVMTPCGASAQSATSEIPQAVWAAPAGLRDDATIIELTPDGSSRLVRQGSNGLMCWVPVDGGRFASMCTSEQNRARVVQNHEFNVKGGSAEGTKALFDKAEKDGSRAVSAFGTMYYHGAGTDPSSVKMHTTIAVPYATAESLGITDQRRSDGAWLMQPGTSSAHLMLPGS